MCAIWTEAALVAAKDKRAAIRAGDLMTAFERVEHRRVPRTPALGASSILAPACGKGWFLPSLAAAGRP